MYDMRCTPAPAPLMAEEQELADLVMALGHPVRVRILRLLCEHCACMCGDIDAEKP